MREILIAVTFRDFIGDYNSKVQTKFLESIKKQTYQNYKLVVTNFKEKHVETYLKQSEVKFVFHQTKHENCWISFTEVVSNTFQHLEKGKNIILFTNADICYDTNFFEEIINNFEPGIGGTSYPPFHYYNINEFEKKKPNNFYDCKRMEVMPPYNKRKKIKSFVQYEPNIFVPECVFIDGDLMIIPENASTFLEHSMLGSATGVSLSLMISFYANKLINLIFISKVHSIESSRITGATEKDPCNDDKEWNARKQINEDHKENESWENYEILKSFCKKRAIEDKWLVDTRFLTHKFRINSMYKPVGNIFQKLYYLAYQVFYIFRVHEKWRWTFGKIWRFALRTVNRSYNIS